MRSYCQKLKSAPAAIAWGTDQLRYPYVSKRVEPGRWVTLETTFSQLETAVFRKPAGARIRVNHWLFSTNEQLLNGDAKKSLSTSLGRIQIRVDATTIVNYAWFFTADPDLILSINLP